MHECICVGVAIGVDVVVVVVVVVRVVARSTCVASPIIPDQLPPLPAPHRPE